MAPRWSSGRSGAPRFRYLVTYLAGAAWLAGCGVGRARPDVVLVVVDTLRADRLGAYGCPLPTSPALDGLAREGLVFRRAISTSTWTKPAVASLFTALYPSEHGLLRTLRKDDPDPGLQALPEELTTLAERFQAGGWATLASVRQPNLRVDNGFAQGFDVYRADSAADDFAAVRALVAELEPLERDRPAFAYLHLLDAHWPYVERLPGLPEDAFGAADPRHGLHADRNAVKRFHQTPRRDAPALDSALAHYDHGVAWIDGALGELFAELERLGRWRESWIVVTADHGESFAEHRRLQHGDEPYDEVARVPLLLRPPASLRLTPGARNSIVSLTDLGPTLVELAGLPPWQDASGRSFAAVIGGTEEPHRVALVESQRARALYASDGKLLLRRDGRFELYDLAQDPGERRNLASSGCTGRCLELLGRLRELDRGLKPPPNPAMAATREPEAVLEQLRALGYL